ncbi:DSBA family oxidoreductase [Lecanosticta acicola]|uniref:Glutathione S-transferase kappa n=1 Tax=Lecanosticta acicola TaxID=111012 RepID=A0AAI8YT32_9PEZI|nr:DSBA family oxidoreductase [Lecanosticta acicola]
MGKQGRIDVYLDCNSPWSFHAYNYLRRNRQALAEHGVTVECHPVFLGGINVGSGNKPPWTLPAKAKYGGYDGKRAQKYFNSGELSPPPFFPIMSLLPMRCMLYAKEHYPYQQYEDAFGELWIFLWKEHKDVSKPEVLAECLSRHFKPQDVEKIVSAGTDTKYKKMLTDQTDLLVQKGAFGAPWFLVTNKEGVEEPFFGSDRFHFMFQYLGVPFQDIQILPPPSTAKL